MNDVIDGKGERIIQLSTALLDACDDAVLLESPDLLKEGLNPTFVSPNPK